MSPQKDHPQHRDPKSGDASPPAHESQADRHSKVPKRPEDTDASGNARNDVGQDNHQRKHTGGDA
ncbi:hypothetical protein [Dyella sp.]|jgi:hypothetical protein|uniref:hypothetical protein n=1 Tax=Dyella sp. TaxID=1869338 RepID=UPI002D780B55|nr:hypothetical protein [Dyella sp.]HET6433120.1 hypothetical protein [Dyella sp.]